MILNHRTTKTRASLWYRIRGAHLPVDQKGRSFADTLADITGLDAAGARRLETEYRRFLYLASITHEGRVPPDLVRVAWSYHAMHDGYSKDFCEWVLGHRLTFAPMPEAPALAYAATVAAYEHEFGAAPPADIWPEPELASSFRHWHATELVAVRLRA
jgi:hypothetical protein